VIQARMSSTRLPGKVLMDIAGRPALRLQLDRLARSEQLDEIVIATSTDPSDDPVADFARANGVRLSRGPLHDVLERYRQAGEESGSDAVVRITGDCPLIDPAITDEVIALWRSSDADYATNRGEPRTYPVGMDTEVVKRSVLETAAREATDPYDREHVTPFVITRPERFPAVQIDLEPSLGHVRLTLDTPDDLELLRRVATAVPDPVAASLADFVTVVTQPHLRP
jgi:spore coat polysaccharide biosynthesis protein SpsF